MKKHIFVGLLVIAISGGCLTGKSLVLLPIDSRLTEERFMIGNVWQLVTNRPSIIEVETIYGKMVGVRTNSDKVLTIESASAAISINYHYNEWTILKYLSNDNANEYFSVYLTNMLLCSNYIITGSLEKNDKELLHRITNDRVLDGYDSLRLSAAKGRGSAIQIWYISNDTAFIGVFSSNMNFSNQVSKIYIPVYFTDKYTAQEFNLALGIGLGYRHKTEWGVLGGNVIPFIYNYQNNKQIPYLVFESDFMWHSMGEVYLRAGDFLFYDKIMYSRAPITLGTYLDPVIDGYRLVSYSKLIESAKYTNDTISNQTRLGMRFGFVRLFYTLDQIWDSSSSVVYNYSTNGTVTNTNFFNYPWSFGLRNTIEIICTDKKMAYGNNNTYFLSARWSWPSLNVESSRFSYKGFFNYNIDEVFSLTLFGEFQHYLNPNEYFFKSLDNSSSSFGYRPVQLMQGYDYLAFAGINYWGFGIISLYLLSTRMNEVYAGKVVVYPEYRIGFSLNALQIKCAVEFRLNRGNELFASKDCWWNNFIFKMGYYLMLGDESDYERYDIVRVFMDTM
ncbi:MAG: hypothetical protein AABZ39_02920 [Spirochaetota bacterium]